MRAGRSAATADFARSRSTSVTAATRAPDEDVREPADVVLADHPTPMTPTLSVTESPFQIKLESHGQYGQRRTGPSPQAAK